MPVTRSSSPSTSRSPMPTATSATDSVVSSSSTMPDRKAMRSVPMVATAVRVAERPHPRAGTALAAVRAQGRQAGQQVEHLRAEPLHGDQPLLGPALRSAGRRAP